MDELEYKEPEPLLRTEDALWVYQSTVDLESILKEGLNTHYQNYKTNTSIKLLFRSTFCFLVRELANLER